MPDPFDELLDEHRAGLKATKKGADPFDVLRAQYEAPYTIGAATAGGYLEGGLPVVGPYIAEGARKGAAGIRSYLSGKPYEEELKNVEDFARRSVAANPDYYGAGALVGGTAGVGPLYGTAAFGARGVPALGRLGENLATRMGVGATSSAALNAADAAARGENPIAGAAMGGVAGATAPAIGGLLRGIVSPFNPISRTIGQTTGQPAIDVLSRAGVPLTAGDVTGSKPLKSFEDILRYYPGIGAKAEDFLTRPHEGFTTAALQRANPAIPAGTLATPDVLAAEHDKLGNAYKAVSAGVNLQTGSKDFRNEIYSALSDYTRAKLVDRSPEVLAWFERMNQMRAMGGLSGSEYQQLRTDLRLNANNALGEQKAATPESNAFTAMRRALDAELERSVGPDKAAEVRDLNRRYGNLRTIEDAMNNTTLGAGKGFLSPAALANAVRKRSADYSRAVGPDMIDLARAGQTVLRPLPESGTGRQAIAAGLLAAGGGAATGALGMRDEEQPFSLSGATAGLIGAPLAAFGAGRAALSPVGQRYLMNTLLSTPRAVGMASGPVQQALTGRMMPTLDRLGE